MIVSMRRNTMLVLPLLMSNWKKWKMNWDINYLSHILRWYNNTMGVCRLTLVSRHQFQLAGLIIILLLAELWALIKTNHILFVEKWEIVFG